MFDLVKKDIFIGSIGIAVIAVVIPFVTLMAILTMVHDFGGLVLGFYIPMIIVLSIGSSFIFIGIDSSRNADALYVSLPVKRSKIIFARYFSSFIMILLSVSLIFLTALVSIQLLNETDPVLMLFLTLRGMTGTILFLLFILAFYLPFVFKFGLGKGMSAALMTQIGLILIVLVGKFSFNIIQGIFAFDLSFISGLLDAIGKWVMGLSANSTYLLIFVVLMVSILISMGLSIRFYKNRDI